MTRQRQADSPRKRSIVPSLLAALGLLGAAIATVNVAADGVSAAPTCVAGPQEAEAGELVGFEIGTDPAASGGAFIHRSDGAGSRWTITSEFQASYCFVVETAGRYRIAAKVWADSGTNDSFFVTVDGTPVGSGRWDVAHVAFGPDVVNSYLVADPMEVDLGAGEHTIGIHLREDGTRLDTIGLEAVDLDPSCTGGWVDAESAQLTGFVAVRDRGAHANQAIWVPEGTGSRWFPSSDQRASFCFTVQQDGIYRLEAVVKAPSASSDSFFVTVDNGPAATWYVTTTNSYFTDLVNAWPVTDPVEFRLTAGNHRVDLYGREDGVYLDRLRFALRPTPQQKYCGGQRTEAENGLLTGFVVGSDGAASNGGYIHVPEGQGSSWAPSDSIIAVYCFNAPQAGNYRIVAGTWADNHDNDSFWVRVGDAGPQGWDISSGTDYGTQVVGFKNANPYVFPAEAGNLVVEVMLREDGTRLDWIGLELVQ